MARLNLAEPYSPQTLAIFTKPYTLNPKPCKGANLKP